MATKSRGRPHKEGAKNFSLRFRMDEKTKNMLDICAESENKSRSEIVREGIEKTYAEVANSEKSGLLQK